MKTKTLSDIMTSVARSTEITESKRRATLSALRVVARCVGREPGDIVGTPAALQKDLAAANYIAAGLTKRRWTNIRCFTLRALRISGAHIADSRIKHAVYLEEWKALRRAIAVPTILIGLSRFMNYCSMNNIKPNEVNEAAFIAFRDQLENHSIIRNPIPVFRRTCRLWDRAGEMVPGWPSHRTKLAKHHRGYSLEWSAFPTFFQEDVEAFLNHGGNQDVFSDDYAPSVRPATTVGRRSLIRQYASALVASGIPAQEIGRLADLVTVERVQIILRFFAARRGGKANASVYSTACLLRTIARTWVKNYSDHPKISMICKNMSRNLRLKRKGMAPRNTKRLRPFNDEPNIDKLLSLPAKLMRLASQLDTGSPHAARLAMVAAAIEILLFAPIRRKNLVEMQIGENLIMPPEGEQSHATVAFAAEEVKNENPIDILLPAASTSLVRRYIKEFRPSLSCGPSPLLFPNKGGEMRNKGGFSVAVTDTILEHTGLEMHVHLFRHFSMKILEKHRPGSAEIGRRLLGHYSIQTTLAAYSENRTADAHRLYEELIESRRAAFDPKVDS